MKNYIGFYGQTNKWTHDHSFAIAKNSSLNYIQLERLTRKKYDNRMTDLLPDLLEFYDIDLTDQNSFNIGYANTFRLDDKFFKISDNNITNHSQSVEFIQDGTEDLLESQVKGKINNILVEATVVPHELAHIFSNLPFYGKFKENSLLVHIDGAASVCNASAWHYKDGKINLINKTNEFHNLLMNFSYNDLSFDFMKVSKENHMSMPGKLMGYASYGQYSDQKSSWLEKNNFFQDYSKNSKKSFLHESKTKFNYDLPDIEHKHQHMFDIASCMQQNFTESLFNFILENKMITNSDYLYFAGGAALNIKLNTRIVNSKLFKDVFIPPPAGDSGLSLGVSYYLKWKENQTLEKFSPYINNYGLNDDNNSHSTVDSFIDNITKDLANDKIIGIFQGMGEAGPRALCHRSIIANPSKKIMKKKVSEDIKKREWYRPIAPVVLKENLEVLFENYVENHISKYMLYEYKVKHDMINKIPAVVHVDNTARAQVIENDDKELDLVKKILRQMDEEYNIPCLINTSLNGPGEPIVHTEDDALKSAKTIGLDRLILNDKYVILRN